MSGVESKKLCLTSLIEINGRTCRCCLIDLRHSWSYRGLFIHIAHINVILETKQMSQNKQ